MFNALNKIAHKGLVAFCARNIARIEGSDSEMGLVSAFTGNVQTRTQKKNFINKRTILEV